MSEIQFENISFLGFGEFERFEKWIAEKVAEGEIREIKKSETPRWVVEQFVQDETVRYFVIDSTQSYWVMSGPGDKSFGGFYLAQVPDTNPNL